MVNVSLEIDVDMWLVEAWTSYKILPNWEVLGGARWQDQDVDVSGLPSPPLPIDSISGGDAVVAGDSERTVNLELFINRRFGDNMALLLGYHSKSNKNSRGWLCRSRR